MHLHNKSGVSFKCLYNSKKLKDHSDIYLTEKEYSFEQKEQKFQKGYWVLLTIFLMCGILGVFGKGVLSNASIEANGYSLHYDRFLRDETPTDVSIVLTEEMTSPVTVEISERYVKNVRIQSITPQPESVESSENRLVFNFNAEEGGIITFVVSPQYVGALPLDISVKGERKYISQFVYF